MSLMSLLLFSSQCKLEKKNIKQNNNLKRAIYFNKTNKNFLIKLHCSTHVCTNSFIIVHIKVYTLAEHFNFVLMQQNVCVLYIPNQIYFTTSTNIYLLGF